MKMASIRRPIGRILTEAGLLSQDQLEQALEEQQRSNEMLGEVLVRMGILEEGEVRAALSVQEHLDNLEQAVRLAAGVRQTLGALLVQGGKLTPRQLDQALDEQQRGGGKLGEVCLRMGLLSGAQLEGILAFQEHQGSHSVTRHPLRLGELLVTAGYLSRENLDDALRKQAVSRKKLGEVLVEQGYAHPSDVTRGVRLQQLLMSSVLATVLSLATVTMSGCGGGMDSPAPSPAAASYQAAPAATAAAPTSNYFTMVSEQYPVIAPTFYYSTNTASFWSIQANLAKSASDIDARCVFRIDIPKNGQPLPPLNRTFSIEEGTPHDKFPGEFLVLNGQKSTNKRVQRGTISFSPESAAGQRVTGSYDVTLTDYDSSTVPAPQYRLKGAFHFEVGSNGPAGPAPLTR